MTPASGAPADDAWADIAAIRSGSVSTGIRVVSIQAGSRSASSMSSAFAGCDDRLGVQPLLTAAQRQRDARGRQAWTACYSPVRCSTCTSAARSAAAAPDTAALTARAPCEPPVTISTGRRVGPNRCRAGRSPHGRSAGPPAGGEVGRPGHVAAGAHHDLGPDAVEHLQYRFQCGDNFVWVGSTM